MDALFFNAAEVGYTEYVRQAGGVSLVSGQPLPVWEELPDNIKYAWEAAASAMYSFYLPLYVKEQ